MTSLKNLMVPAALALLPALPAMAQDIAAQDTPPACDQRFAALDTDGNGFLTEEEAPAIFARMRIDGTSVAAEGYSAADFLATCEAGTFERAAVEAGAPFAGANSFTEEQARDRAVAWGYAYVSALTLDDEGIWRGTARDDDADVGLAIDFKGNVVATPN